MNNANYLISITLLTLVTAEMVRFDNYKVYRVMPYAEEHLEILRNLQNDPENVYDFWTDPSFIGKPVDIMVPPKYSARFHQMIKMHNLHAVVNIENVQKAIDMERPAASTTESKTVEWTAYHNLEEINAWLNELAANSTNLTVVKAGKTFEGRDILAAGISFSPNNYNKTVFIEGGIHAREWIAPATVTYLINEILYSKNATTLALLQSFDWYLVPVFNPDGYNFTWTTDRLWRKTRKPYGNCIGADPNRNWNTSWMAGGASQNPCSDVYAGPSPFSESETKSLSDFITSIASRLHAYIAFHSFSQLLMFPYGNTSDHLGNYDELLSIGLKAAKSLAARYGTKYKVGNIAETIYVATGGSMDWVKATFGTRITYTYELRDKGENGFILPPEQILPNCLEIMDSLITILNESLKSQNATTY